MNKLVSILVNCRNGEKYLGDSINSILNQSYKKFEIIFFDNASEDNSLKIIKSFKDKRIKILRTKKCLSLYAARNKALNYCKGSFITFLDVDDFWHKDFLLKRRSFFNQNNFMFSYCNWNFFYQKKKKIIKKKDKIFSGMIFDHLSRNYIVKISGLIINKKVFSLLKKKFAPKYNIIGDYEFVMRMALTLKGQGLKERLVTIRIHKNNYSNINRKLHYKEYYHWYKNLNNNNKKIIENKKYFYEKLLYLKIISFLLNRKKNKVIKDIFIYPNNIKKLKLLLIFLTPQFILNKLLNR